MDWDISTVWRVCPSTLPMALHFVLDTNDEALQWFRMNQHSGYLLQKEHIVKSDWGTILKFPFL